MRVRLSNRRLGRRVESQSCERPRDVDDDVGSRGGGVDREDERDAWDGVDGRVWDARIARPEGSINVVVSKLEQLLDDRSVHPRYEESSQATSVHGPHPLVDDDYDDDGSSLGPDAVSAVDSKRPQTSAGQDQQWRASDERKVYQPEQRRPGTIEWTGRQR